MFLSPQEYKQHLESAGFIDVTIEDCSGVWREFVAERLAMFRAAEARHVRVHGSATVQALDRFYAAVVRLFQAGNVGGIKLTATRP